MKKSIIVLVIVLLITIFICYANNSYKNNLEVLTPIRQIDLSVPEPSGLEYDSRENILLTVSDETSRIYKMDLEGNVLKEIKVNGIDLEGITKPNDSTLATILERARTVVFLDTSGVESGRIELNLKGEPNKGLEGITYNPKNSHYYVLNEKKPRLLMEIDSDNNIIKKNKLEFASDFSGIYFDSRTETLWILSDESETIFKCDENGTLIKEYQINIEQAEGIAINYEDSLLYVISDPLEKLFIFKLP